MPPLNPRTTGGEMMRRTKMNGIEVIADQHWDWLHGFLSLTSISFDEVRRLEYIYKTAFIHGAKHGQEILTKSLNPKEVTNDNSN